MPIQFVLLPLFVQVGLTFAVLFIMGGRRFRAIRHKELTGPITLREANWPTYALQAQYNYQNQFEIPVVFYVLTILAIMTKHADLLFLLMSWVFVTLRILHAGVHLTSNNVRLRGPLFGAGALVLLLMWVIFVVRLLLGLP